MPELCVVVLLPCQTVWTTPLALDVAASVSVASKPSSTSVPRTVVSSDDDRHVVSPEKSPLQCSVALDSSEKDVSLKQHGFRHSFAGLSPVSSPLDVGDGSVAAEPSLGGSRRGTSNSVDSVAATTREIGGAVTATSGTTSTPSSMAVSSERGFLQTPLEPPSPELLEQGLICTGDGLPAAGSALVDRSSRGISSE